ncbi:unnamed protein product [Gulo gulo]|uniref:Uncharacterized protein n=1 Tax=Gulo gulo TaxID=48420 RepID=A0A9X9MCA5_GULGU|nr:unnamed protein product [Gulo gulo]
MSCYLQILHKEIDVSRNEAPLPRSQKHQPNTLETAYKKEPDCLVQRAY